jgi:hypothetical protein
VDRLEKQFNGGQPFKEREGDLVKKPLRTNKGKKYRMEEQ